MLELKTVTNRRPGVMTLIEIKPHAWGWKVFEAPGVEPVFPQKRQSSALKTESRSVLARISHPSSVMTIKG